ncbi:MAG: aromatic amino acid transport family protein [Candidatus Bathyarchaeia archaeon]
MASGEPEFSREELLQGFSAKRASTLLFAIESWTAQHKAKSRQMMERFLTQDAADERNLAFLEALALGREPPMRPTIQDLERYAPQWAFLVPDSPKIRAALAHILGKKYRPTRQAVPGIRAVLGLDGDQVQRTYRQMYGQPLDAVFATRDRAADSIRWAWTSLGNRVDSLPPFWTAFGLTLTETVGAGYLALPIAVAGIGPLAGMVILISLGLVNVLTIAFMSEALIRNGSIRYGSIFIGRLAEDYLGRVGSLMLIVSLFASCWLALIADYVGFAVTLADATGVRAELWVGLLFLVGVYVVRFKSLSATVASALVVGAVNIALILILSLLALGYMQPANLLYVNLPVLSGRTFHPSVLYLVFGVVLSAYFGHTSLGSCAQVVLRRDPGGRSLMCGAVSATATAAVIYCIWVFAVNGAVAPQVLVGESGTALVPLADVVGSVVYLFGSILVILGLGMSSIINVLGLFNVTREWSPTRRHVVVRLPRRRGQLLLRSSEGAVAEGKVERPGVRLGLTYLGLTDDKPEFRLDIQADDVTRRTHIVFGDTWNATATFEQIPKLRKRGFFLTLQVHEASQESVLVHVDSSLKLTPRGEWDTVGLTMADLVALPEDQRRLVNWLLRQGTMKRQAVTAAEAATHLGQDETKIRNTLDALVSEGLVKASGDVARAGDVRYEVCLTLRRGRKIPEEIWKALEKGEASARTDAGFVGKGRLFQPLTEVMLSRLGRCYLPLIPAICAFLLTEWLVMTGTGSFTEILSVMGVILVSLLGGIFPDLLMVASRRKGERLPAVIYRLLGNPLITAGVYLLFLVTLFLHGLLIWQDALPRALALLVGAATVSMTIAMRRQGAFVNRTVLELLEDQRESGRAFFTITEAGQPRAAEVSLRYPDKEEKLQAASGEISSFSSIRCATVQLPASLSRELKVWAHRTTSDGYSESLPGILHVDSDNEKREFDLRLSDGEVILPLNGKPCLLTITFTQTPSDRTQNH